MSTQENKDIARRYFDERWNHGNLDVYDEMLSPDLDIDGFKEWTRIMYAALGDIQLTILDLIAEVDQVAVHWMITATHQGEFLNVPATGKTISYKGVALLRFVEGKIADDRAYYDNQAILKQMGVTLPRRSLT